MGSCYTKLVCLLLIFNSSLAFASTNKRVSAWDLIKKQQNNKSISDVKKREKYKARALQTDKKNINKNGQPAHQAIWVTPVGESLPETARIPARTQLVAKLSSNLINTNYNDEVVASITSDYQDSGLKNSTIIGRYKINPKHLDRVFINFHTLISTSGREQIIKATALDRGNGELGLTAKVDDKTSENILKVIGDTATAIIGVATYAETAGLSGRILDQTAGKQLDNIDTNAVVSIEKGTRFKVVFDRPLNFVTD
jgi:hypothetical protein